METLGYAPTFEEASVKLFRVVLLPDEGFPTKPINGSRPILYVHRVVLKVVSLLFRCPSPQANFVTLCIF